MDRFFKAVIIQSVFIFLAAILFGITYFLAVPVIKQYERDNFPVVIDFQILDQYSVGNKTYIKPSFSKVRDCDFEYFYWVKDQRTYVTIFPSDKGKDPVSKPVGDWVNDYWEVNIPNLEDAEGYSVHKCLAPWLVTTKAYPSESCSDCFGP